MEGEGERERGGGMEPNITKDIIVHPGCASAKEGGAKMEEGTGRAGGRKAPSRWWKNATHPLPPLPPYLLVTCISAIYIAAQ